MSGDGGLPLFEMVPATEGSSGDVAADTRWARWGTREVERVRRALGTLALTVHHVGATALPAAGTSSGTAVLDLLAETETLDRLARARLRLLAQGFELAAAAHPAVDCKVYIVDDLLTGERRAELRCYPAGHPEAERAPALCALLRARPELARAYLAHKAAARAAHARNEAAYHAAKQEWLECVLDEALALWRQRRA